MLNANTPDVVSEHVTSLFDLFKAQGDGAYIGESISQLEHSLQAAHFAAEDNAPPTTIIAALLHDVGQFIPHSEAADMLDEHGASVGRRSHDKLGAEYLRSHGWPESVYKLVGAHVEAKRYLAMDQEYEQSLSRASQASLRAQGGKFTQEQKAAFEQDPLWSEKVRLRTYDDRSKVVGLQVPDLSAYRSMAEDILRSEGTLRERL